MVDTTGGDHWAWFGDGNMAQILSATEVIDKKNGKKYCHFLFIPSMRIRSMYNVDTDLNNTELKKYHWTDVVWLERGVVRSRCLIKCDYNGNRTPLSRRYDELSEALKDAETLFRGAQAAKNRAYYELNTEREQKLEAIKQQVLILKELSKAKGRTRDDDVEDMELDGGG